MKTKRKRIPQHEFAFAPGAFNLMQERGEDTERTAREREQAERGRAAAEKGQAQLFNPYGMADLRRGYRRVHRRYVRPLMRRFGFTEQRRRRPVRHKRRLQLRRRLTV